MFVSVPTKFGTRSLELERHARAELGRLFRAGEIPAHTPNWIIAEGSNRTLRTISWIETSDHLGAIAETAMQHQNLGSWVQFAIRGIVLNELQNNVSAIVRGAKPALPLLSINERVKDFEDRFELLMSFRNVSG